MKAIYILLAYLFYFLGDLCSKIPTELFFTMYQRFMNLSLDFDSKCGYKIWKSPRKTSCKKRKKLR